MKPFTGPFTNTLSISVRKITVEAEDVVSACRSAIDASYTTDGGKAWTRNTRPTSALVVEGADIDPWRFVPDGGDASVLPVPRLFLAVAACAGYAATRSEDLVDQLAHRDRRDRRR